MLLPIKPICKRNKMRKDGTCLIFIQYCHTSDKRTLLNTDIAIPPNYWNRKSGRIAKDLPKEYGDAAKLNADLQAQIRKAEDIVAFAQREKIQDMIEFLKTCFVKGFNEQELKEKSKKTGKTNIDVYFQLDQYIEAKRNKVVPGMLKVYKNLKDHLQSYELYRKEKITFDSFDYVFYEGFVEFLTLEYIQRRRKETFKGLRVSTVGKTIKQLRIFLTDRMKRKVIPHFDLSEFKVLTEESDAIYLNNDEIRKILVAEIAEQHLQDVRNMFVLGCLTGLRFSDFSSIRPEDIRNGMLHKKQQKSDHWVVIPLREEAHAILKNKFKGAIPTISNALFNRYIKEVGRAAGLCDLIKFTHRRGGKDIVIVKQKYDWITSHTCRRSFCTNEFLAGTPVELIMKISGHRSVQDFYKYIKISPEQAGHQIREIWQQRGEIAAK